MKRRADFSILPSESPEDASSTKPCFQFNLKEGSDVKTTIQLFLAILNIKKVYHYQIAITTINGENCSTTIYLNPQKHHTQNDHLINIFAGFVKAGLLFHPIMPYAFFESLNQLNYELDNQDLISGIKTTLGEIYLNFPQKDLFFSNFLENVKYILLKIELSNTEYNNLLGDIILHSIRIHTFKLVISSIENIEETLIDLNKKFHLLHHAFKYQENEAIDILWEILAPEKNGSLYDVKKNSFLHLCQRPDYYEKLLALLPDINQKNKLGNTPLHMAAIQSNEEKILFLVRHKANLTLTNRNNKNYWELANNQLKLSLKLKSEGFFILPPPANFPMQKGPTCGLYATATAIKILQNQHQIPSYAEARKSDVTPHANISLRQICKEKNWTTIGEILSVEKLQKLINAAGVASTKIDIVNYEHFIKIVKKGLREGFPIIIPINNSALYQQPFNPRRVHWSLIVGIHDSDDKILFAQYSEYSATSSKNLFDAFNQTCDEFPESKFIKYKSKGWVCEPANVETTFHFRLFPAIKLNDFYRKLIIVHPQHLTFTEAISPPSSLQLAH